MADWKTSPSRRIPSGTFIRHSRRVRPHCTDRVEVGSPPCPGAGHSRRRWASVSYHGVYRYKTSSPTAVEYCVHTQRSRVLFPIAALASHKESGVSPSRETCLRLATVQEMAQSNERHNALAAHINVQPLGTTKIGHLQCHRNTFSLCRCETMCLKTRSRSIYPLSSVSSAQRLSVVCCRSRTSVPCRRGGCLHSVLAKGDYSGGASVRQEPRETRRGTRGRLGQVVGDDSGVKVRTRTEWYPPATVAGITAWVRRLIPCAVNTRVSFASKSEVGNSADQMPWFAVNGTVLDKHGGRCWPEQRHRPHDG